MQSLTMPRGVGLRPARPALPVCRPSITKRAGVQQARRSTQVTRALGEGYMGSPTNIIMSVSVVLFLAAGRWGLAPTANRNTNAGLKLQDTNRSGQFTTDPAGFTAVDCFALGAMGHLVGVGIVLGLKLDGVIPWQ